MYSGPKVTLNQVLASRERRANRQKEWVEAHSLPLISFTINMMGEVKRNEISRVAFDQGYQTILDVCRIQDIPVVGIEKFSSDTGVELLIAAGKKDAEYVKRAMVSIEDEHPLGRLFDIDVLDDNCIAVSRDNLELPRRKCLVCDNEAKVCARSRAHQLSELKDKMSEMIHDFK
ncbi:citrate lyase holo-[acyl-carrier protein] synthase [Vibrio sp. JC009]|uniref:citrate lyase holo-[acyl-carrier protein] synthase n=1 Tax=Vibrio sp. JC009 TaxID=2912314 RepID=UPI0023AE767C|nr:citrate lyase holo-[acyl-carrier protein] synthase [Vibrio sp. JC009]WED23958.1 citrate lyase holo-[acyl-carrier protein] synthase [Vibrio sp. JC009]